MHYSLSFFLHIHIWVRLHVSVHFESNKKRNLFKRANVRNVVQTLKGRFFIVDLAIGSAVIEKKIE